MIILTGGVDDKIKNILNIKNLKLFLSVFDEKLAVVIRKHN